MQDVLMRLGQEVASDQTCHDMMRQGRPLTNFEMMAYRLRKAKRILGRNVG